jgi:energy-coupling factor transport system ATP-binding protein
MIDVAGRAEILAILDRRRAMGCGILRVTHDVSEAMLADRVLILDQGVVAFIGSPEDLIRSGLSLSDLGLEVPRALRLVLTLREAGVIDGDGMPGPAGIVEALCR